MDRKELEKKVIEIIADKLGKNENEISLDSQFIADLGADSLDVVELIMGFEDAFGIEIPDEDAEKIATVKDAVDYIEAKMGK